MGETRTEPPVVSRMTGCLVGKDVSDSVAGLIFCTESEEVHLD